MASPIDLVTVLYRPRETMRRVLDGPRRWSVRLVVLAFLCASVGDANVGELRRRLPDLSGTGTFALVALTLLSIAACWVLFLYAFAWAATMAGRWLEGRGEVADVRAALAWATVPVIWSVILRIPLVIYFSRFTPQSGDVHRMVRDFVNSGGCTIAVLAFGLQIVLYLWMAYVGSATVAEALHLPVWKGLAAIVITMAIPVIVVVAAVLAMKT